MSRSNKAPKWHSKAMEVLDRFETRDKSVIHIKFTLDNLAEMIGVSRQTLSKKGSPFHPRYLEVKQTLKTLGDGPLTEKRKKRLSDEQRIRKLERERDQLKEQLAQAQLRWLAVLRLAEREQWAGFEFKLNELINPRSLMTAVDSIRKPEE